MATARSPSRKIVRLLQRHVALHLKVEVDEFTAARAARAQLVIAGKNAAMLVDDLAYERFFFRGQPPVGEVDEGSRAHVERGFRDQAGNEQ
jgi:hypothetical protein